MNNVSSPRGYRKTRNLLLLIISILGAVLIIQLFLNLVVMPRMRIGQVLLESTLQMPDQDLLKMGGITGRINYMTLDERVLRASYEASPLVRKAFVQKQFPRTLKIVLYGRNPLGVALLNEGDKVFPAVFDDEGIIFHKGGRLESYDLPVLSGIRFGNVQVGMALPEVLLPVLRDLKKLQDDSPLLYDQISEIQVKKSGGEYYYLKLYLSSYSLPVVVAPAFDDLMIKKMLLVLDVLKGKKMLADIEYADFRSGQVVLKMREDL